MEDYKSQLVNIHSKLDKIFDLLGIERLDPIVVTSAQVISSPLLEINKALDSEEIDEKVTATKQSWIDGEVHRADNCYLEEFVEKKPLLLPTITVDDDEAVIAYSGVEVLHSDDCLHLEKSDGSVLEEISERREVADVVFQVFDEMTESIQATLLEEQMHTTMAHTHTKLDVLLDGTVGDVQPIEVQKVTGPYAYHIFDEMTPMSQAEGTDDQLIDPYIGGIDFKNITLFDPGGDRKYAMSSSRRVFPALFDKARGTSDNGLEGVDWGIFCMEGDASKVFDEMLKPDLTEAAEYTSLKAGVWLMDEFERIYPSKDGMVIVSYHVFDEVSKPLPMKIYHLSAGLNHFNEMPNQIIDPGGSSLHVEYATQHSLDQSKVKHDYDTISYDLQECELWGVSLQWLTMRRQTSDHHLFHAMPELIVAGHTEGNEGLKSCEYLVVCYPNDMLYEADVPEVFVFTFDPGTITTLRSLGLTWVENESHRSINPWIVRGSSWYEHSAIEFSGKQRSQSMMQQSGSQQSSFMGCSKLGCNFFDETSKPFSVDLQENVYGGAMRRNKYELPILARTIADNIDEFVSIKLMINEITGLSNHNIRFVMLVSLGYYISVLFLDGVLWVHMIDFPSMSKLEFNPQVYDPGTGAYLVGILAHSVTSHPFNQGYVIGLKACIGVCVCIADWGVTKACKPQMQALIQHLQWVEEAFYKDDVSLPSANKFLLEMLINGTKIVGMATGHTKLHGHKPVVFAVAFVLNNFVWDPGQDAISLYIIEDNDVLKIKGIGIHLASAYSLVEWSFCTLLSITPSKFRIRNLYNLMELLVCSVSFDSIDPNGVKQDAECWKTLHGATFCSVHKVLKSEPNGGNDVKIISQIAACEVLDGFPHLLFIPIAGYKLIGNGLNVYSWLNSRALPTLKLNQSIKSVFAYLKPFLVGVQYMNRAKEFVLAELGMVKFAYRTFDEMPELNSIGPFEKRNGDDDPVPLINYVPLVFYPGTSISLGMHNELFQPSVSTTGSTIFGQCHSFSTFLGQCKAVLSSTSNDMVFIFDPGGRGEIFWFWIKGVFCSLYRQSHECLVMCLGSHITSLVDKMKRADMGKECNVSSVLPTSLDDTHLSGLVDCSGDPVTINTPLYLDKAWFLVRTENYDMPMSSGNWFKATFSWIKVSCRVDHMAMQMTQMLSLIGYNGYITMLWVLTISLLWINACHMNSYQTSVVVHTNVVQGAAMSSIFVWDPGVYHFTTLRTRRLLRGRICHDPRFKSDKYELLSEPMSYVTSYILSISYFIF